ncbi:capsular polysaccharide transport system permease protein [Epibacterium ulvae]|uniref:Transport permease protein n=1 Tax=Epibacterium ulvae TaxID=1156985 RepID=A0A1G5RD06_9RHOB|nr:ABC transporter permease [Epibacterium ulvae]SCZ71886.1 capsular polysaccharide transport system permease protein [Epibacterium ulvae]
MTRIAPSSPAPPDADASEAAFAPAQPPAVARTRSFATTRVVVALILREMSTRYGRTPGGYLWSIVEPLAAILFLSVGFSLVIRTPSLGNSFLLFYATGFLPFNLYRELSGNVSRALTYSRPLLRYPAVTWIDAILARFLLNSLTGSLTALLLLSGILLISDSRAVLDIPSVVSAMGLAMLVGLGVGTLNAVLLGLFPIWDVIWSVLNRPLFLASGVLFLFEDMPPVAREILWYNPLMHVAGLMRTGFYPTYGAHYVNVSYVLLLSLGLLALGLLLMGRYHREILNR